MWHFLLVDKLFFFGQKPCGCDRYGISNNNFLNYFTLQLMNYVIYNSLILNIIYETSRQSRFDARYWMLGAGALGRPRGMVWGGRREEGSGWGTRVYLWRIHVDIWQNQYNIVKLKNKKINKIEKKNKHSKGHIKVTKEER